MSKNKPNIIFIITDQQRYDTINELGYPHMETPTLDKMISLNLKERCVLLHRLYPSIKIKATTLSRIYKEYGVKKKVIKKSFSISVACITNIMSSYKHLNFFILC